MQILLKPGSSVAGATLAKRPFLPPIHGYDDDFGDIEVKTDDGASNIDYENEMPTSESGSEAEQASPVQPEATSISDRTNRVQMHTIN